MAGLENVLQGWGFGGCQFVIVLYRKPLGTGTVNVNEGGAENAGGRERGARVFAHVSGPVGAHFHDDFYRSQPPVGGGSDVDLSYIADIDSRDPYRSSLY